MSKLNLNHSPLKQPEGTVRFQLNAVTDLEHLGSDANEIGNSLCYELETSLAGPPVFVDRERFLFFLKNNSIWLININTCEATQHCQLDCFGWDTLDTDLYPVTATTRIVRGCENIIYFFDGIHTDKFVNIDRPEKQQTDGFFDCDKFEFNISVVHPTIVTEILNSGGQTSYGTYNFAVEYLSSNEDIIFTSPVDINYTPIIYQNNEGALNLETNLPEIGGKPISNKSIKLTITNIPNDAVLARIVVFRHATGDGFTSDAHVVGDLIPVNGSTLEYIYRGFNVSNGDYLVDKNEYLTPKAIYESSLHAVQVNNRLVRYNLKETTRDYSNYQEKASKICSKYVVKEVSKNDPNVYLLNRTLLGGEIILPCINYVHKDGSISNSYSLIGRAKLPNDEVLVDDILNNGQQVEKWKYYDTSIKDATPITGYVSSGEFGYYESDQTYTDPPNYCGSNYWGTDCDGNNIENSPIRLFVVPDRSVEPHDVDDTIRPIGIWFDETTIEYPNNDVVGHYFSIVVVNQSNIEAKGIASNKPVFIDNDDLEIYRFDPFYTLGLQSSRYHNFISTENLLLEKYVNGTHLVKEGVWEITGTQTDEIFDNIYEDDLPYENFDFSLFKTNADTYTPTAQELKILEKSISISENSTVSVDNIIYKNPSVSNRFNYLVSDTTFANTDFKLIRYISVKNYINPIPNIWSIDTRRITDLNQTVSFNGNSFISELNVDNIAFVLGVDGLFFWQSLDIKCRGEVLLGFYVEGRANSYLRHTGSTTCSTNLQNDRNFNSFFFNKVSEVFKDKYKVKDSICPFFPGYNKDYSYIQDLNRYSTIGLTFDFCSECSGLFPHRMIFSPQSFAEDLADGYRINKANDYIDIPANTGSIIAVDYKDNKLVVRTERSCYFLQPNPQQMETSESNVYIGTGDFLSIPPQELNISQPGYGGQQHKLDSINCERGLVWSDRQRGEIYSLGGQFVEVSNDMNKWFIDNLPSLKHLIFGYDPIHDRIMMTGKDSWTLSYCFKENGWKSWHSYIPSWYVYNASNYYSVLDNGFWEHNKGLFCNFYGIQFPHVVEMIVKAEGQTFLPQSVIYHANTYDLSNGYEQDVIGTTYDQFLAYNDTQSTGIQDLILNSMDDVYWNPTTTHVKQVDRNYKISPLKDLATSSNIWDMDISSIKVGTQGYFRFLPLVDANKHMVEIGSFRSKWMGVWLIFNNPNYKISLEYQNSNLQNSIR